MKFNKFNCPICKIELTFSKDIFEDEIYQHMKRHERLLL